MQEFYSNEIDKIIDTLSADILDPREWIVWIGAGLSVDVNQYDLLKKNCYPKMQCLIAILIAELKEQYPGHMELKKLDPDQKDCFELISELELIDKPLVESLVMDIYGHLSQTVRAEYAHLTEVGFKGFITTNYDYFLKNCTKSKIYSNLDICDIEKDKKSYALYLHGNAGNGKYDNLILSKRTFDEYYGEERDVLNLKSGNPNFKLALINLLRNSNILFLGCSLNEAVFEELFRFIRMNLNEYKDSFKYLKLDLDKKAYSVPDGKTVQRLEPEKQYLDGIIQQIFYPPYSIQSKHRAVHDVVRGLSERLKELEKERLQSITGDIGKNGPIRGLE